MEGEGAVTVRRSFSACWAPILVRVLLPLLPLLAGLGTGVAEDGASDEFYGAIAYSPSNRAHGWSYDYPSRRDAERRALAQCRRHAEDCIVPVWFRNAC